MRRYISAILISSLMLQLSGCSSFKPLENDENLNGSNYLGEEELRFTLKNGQEIQAKVREVETVKNHKFIVFGSGISLNKTTQESKYFNGKLNEEQIDSVKKITINSKDKLVCWLKDSTKVSFDYNKFLTFTLKPDSSYWLIKNFDSPEAISANDISSIEVGNPHLTSTTMLISLLVLLGITVVFFTNLSLFGH